MAAVTVSGGLHQNVVGRNRSYACKLTAPANGDTLTLPLQNVHAVEITFASTPVAADAVAATVVSTGPNSVITFVVVGTARNLWVRVEGR